MANVTLEQQLQRKILVIDGAMGTMIQSANLSAADFGGEAYEGCNEYLTLTAPHVIRRIHEAYLEAGADIIETNTFGATRIVLDEYGLGHLALELNIEADQTRPNKRLSRSPPRTGRALSPVRWGRRRKRCR